MRRTHSEGVFKMLTTNGSTRFEFLATWEAVIHTSPFVQQPIMVRY